MSELLTAAHIWPALVLGIAAAALVWLLGLGRLRGAIAAGGALAGLFVAGHWPAATVGIGAFLLAGVMGRVAEAADDDPTSGGRLTLRVVTGMAAPGVVLALAAALSGASATLWLACVGALAGGTAIWCGRVIASSQPDVGGLGYAVTGGAALALAGLAHGQRLIGPGEGATVIVAALLGMAIVGRPMIASSLRTGAGSVVSAVLAVLIGLLLP